MRKRFDFGQMASFRIAEEVQVRVGTVDSSLLGYEKSHRPEDRSAFEKAMRGLGDWVVTQRTTLIAAPERVILDEMQAAFDELSAAITFDSSAAFLDQLAGARTAETKLIDLGLKLAYAHRETLHAAALRDQSALIRLQSGILVAQLIGMLLSGAAAWITYREMVAPLRVELLESQALVARSEKLAALGEFAAGVAHEIRNPLTAIKARLFTQQKALLPGSRERVDAEFIGREIDRLEKIVSNFLRFARPAEPERISISPADLLREVKELLAPKLRESSIAFLVERAVDTRISADSEQLKQVLINLVNNAADALGERGTIKLRAIDSRMKLGERFRAVVVLEVEDDGPGISPEVRKRLFDPFFSTKASGTGLGLSIAARIVEKHGGALRVQNAPGHGAIFGIVLPIEERIR